MLHGKGGRPEIGAVQDGHSLLTAGPRAQTIRILDSDQRLLVIATFYADSYIQNLS
jgi:hypothetical protein